MKLSKKEEYLFKNDKKLSKLIESNGHIAFKPEKENQFNSLVKIVISQFISTSAANTIFENIKDRLNTDCILEKHFRYLSESEIKKLGLSTNKARTIKELSLLYSNNDFQDHTKLNYFNYNEKLLSVFGIGPWSVSMFEIFCLGKLNIFSSRDAGLRVAMNNLGMIKEKSVWEKYDKYAEKWSPYKTIASLHLWKSVD